jgi:dTDP-4-amino-4,6-dideoxygalactose transaminase
MALDIKKDDEIITTPFTFFATAGAIKRIGAKPVFVDITLDDFNIDIEKITKKITSKTKAIISVDLFGLPAKHNQIRKICDENNLYFIDDACQAIGSKINGNKIGNIADFTCFSFFPTKNLGAYGDAGMLLVKDELLAKKVKKLRVHGAYKKYHHEYLGINSRLDSLQAGILNVKLNYLDEWIKKRQENAKLYDQLLNDNIKKPNQFISDRTGVYHQYSILLEKRDELKEYLKKKGVQTAIYYPLPLHLQEVFKDLGYLVGDFPNSEYASKHILSLPVHENLEKEEIEYICDVINEFYN